MAYRRCYQDNIFEHDFQASLDQHHELVRLGDRIDWDQITRVLAPYYSSVGRPAKSLRLIVGLLILKHRFDLSDEVVVAQLHENLYWMRFCGVWWYPGDSPPQFVEASTLTKFRRRVGAEGMARVEAVIKGQLISEQQMVPRTLLVDTTAMEKHIAYPTDSRLLHRGRAKLVKTIRRLQQVGVATRRTVRSFSRLGKRAITEINKLGKGRQDRIEENTKKLAGYAQAVITQVPDVLEQCRRYLTEGATAVGHSVEHQSNKTVKAVQRLAHSLGEQTEVLKRIVHQAQQRFQGHHVKNKVYSLHEPQVACIRKGKRSRPDEYGCKVLLSTDHKGYVVSHREYFSNPSDTGLLEDAVRDWQTACGKTPHEVGADRGFHRASYEGPVLEKVQRFSVPRKGKTPHSEADRFWFKRVQKRRAAIEPIIGHLKTDHRMNRCRYQGPEGDRINMCLVTMAWNLRKWGKVLCPV
jgi:IS5 family transposase